MAGWCRCESVCEKCDPKLEEEDGPEPELEEEEDGPEPRGWGGAEW